jgi:hypothetical protein
MRKVMVRGVQGYLSRAALGLWAALSVVVVGYTLGAHLTSLPAPASSDPALVNGLRALFPSSLVPHHAAGTGSGERDLLVVHILYDRCGCSSRVGKSLVARGARSGVREVVLLVSDDPATTDHTSVAQLEAAGFPVVNLSTSALAERLHVQAVPLLVIVGGAGRLLYVGGYQDRQDSPRIEDQRLIGEAEADHSPAPLPIFGCATAAGLQRRLDPFGIKYGR